jgi:hypothetical protein
MGPNHHRFTATKDILLMVHEETDPYHSHLLLAIATLCTHRLMTELLGGNNTALILLLYMITLGEPATGDGISINPGIIMTQGMDTLYQEVENVNIREGTPRPIW